MNNENKKISRNKKRRIERRIKIVDKMKSLLSKIESEKKKKIKDIDKVKQIEIELPKIKYFNNPNFLESNLKELNEIQYVDETLHSNKYKILRDYAGEFEMIGKVLVGDQIRITQIRFRSINDYES